MHVVDLVVVGGTVVTPQGRVEGTVAVADGRVAAVLDPAESVRAERTVDATGCWVVPGAVDPHVHLRAPGTDPAESFADDFESGTRAALAGGVTTVGQMAFPADAGETLRSALQRDEEGLRALATSDWFLHPSTVHTDAETATDLAWCVERGHPSLKTTLFALDAAPGSGPDGARHLVEAFAAAAAWDVPVLVHCEDLPLIEHATRLLEARGADLSDYPDSRPVLSERASVERAVAIAELTGARLYVVHLSSREALEVTERARARGIDVLVETRPIYLTLTRAAYAGERAIEHVGMPPLREDDDVESLWMALASGAVDTIGSDHAPWTRQQRGTWTGSLDALRKGVAELDTYYPLLVETGVLAGRMSLERLVEVVAAAPARIFGLADKGRLAPGADADVVVLDPTAARRVDPGRLQTRAAHSPYDGRVLRGWPRVVLSRGEVVLADEVVTAAPGRGRAARRVTGRSS